MLAVMSARGKPYNGENLMAENDSSMYRDHFTPADRRELIQTGERLAGLKEDFAELKRTIESGSRHHADIIRQLEVDLKSESRRTDAEIRGALKDLDQRTRILENFRWWVLGAAGFAGAATGFLSRFLHT